MLPGPDARVKDASVKITEEYARLVGCEAYFWAWPMINVYSRRLAFGQVPEPGIMGGVLPVAPLNRLAMLPDYILPNQGLVACPNQDVVDGAASLALEVSPVVVQVPDFGGRFWVFEVSDIRTDNFAQLGAMYGTPPGFYLHFFVPNQLDRYSLGTKNRDLVYNPDGSLTLYVQVDPPPEAQRANWLPAPKDADFSLIVRAYWPKAAVLDGSWTPPAVEPVK
jgi:hypothetical protein